LTGRSVVLALTADDAASLRTSALLFSQTPLVTLGRDDLRPSVPFDGPLFDVLSAQPLGACVGLVVPAQWAGTAGAGGSRRSADAHAPVAGDAVPVVDHVNLEFCGPLTGRWPADVPRAFPSMTGIYQPGLVRPSEGARVYSSGVVAAGVADVGRLTRFEARAIDEGGCAIVADSLVPAAIVAAYYGLRLAACGVLQAPRSERE
jgi:hypothetical protein